jgi:hypothetical protein
MNCGFPSVYGPMAGGWIGDLFTFLYPDRTLHKSVTSGGISMLFIRSVRVINCTSKPASRCHTLWQCRAHRPGLSLRKRIYDALLIQLPAGRTGAALTKAQAYGSTVIVSLLIGLVVYTFALVELMAA